MSNSRHFILAAMLCTGCAAPDVLEFTVERFDFGAALPGTLRQTQVRLLNTGERRLHLAATSSTNPAFKLVFPNATFLTANESVQLTVEHTPPVGAMAPQAATLTVQTDEGPQATLEVSSAPTTPDCTLPHALEFGPVKPGDFATMELTLRNPTALLAQAEIEQVSAPNGAFVVEHGRHSIPPGGEVKVPISFLPRITAEFSGAVTLRPHPLCTTHRVSLFGTGVTRFLVPAPTTLVWSTGLGLSEAQLLTLRNRTLTPVALFDVQTREGASPSQVFRAVRFPLRIPAAVRSANGQLIPGEASIEVSFTPADLDEHLGLLSFSTDLAVQPLVEVQLAGFGR